jgi:acyl-CoA reductase-like NAD-dependent aldehyde dehydrogenase
MNAAIDRLIYYAGWADKYQQLFSSVNPVAQPYFNYSTPEATGVVSIVAIAPVIVGGNSCVVLASHSKPLSSISFAEVLQTSDVPPGVVNILTGQRSELLEQFASHMDVNAVSYFGDDAGEIKTVEENASLNVKRVAILPEIDLQKSDAQGPYHILKTQEIKTTWHPIGV